MAYIITKNSVLGLKAETTEGTLIAPAAVTDYLKLQPDVAIAENKETLENAEMTGSIGVSKPIQGISVPTMSFSSYIRGSGTEGTAPDNGPLLKALFGTVAARSTERNTVASSTVSVVKVDSGEGVEFQRGDALLIKDGTNGYSIRPVHSVSTDDLTLGFDLSNAPGTGVDLGKSVTYIPQDTSHDTLSMHMYWGDGGLYQAISGARVLSCDITADAGQLINSSFALEGINFYNNPIYIASTDTKIDFTETGPVTTVATIAAKAYADPEELASAMQTAMNAVATADTFTVTYNSTGANAGKFTFASNGSLFSLLWSSGANTANTVGDQIGFTVAADDTGALTYTSDSAVSWASPDSGSITYDEQVPISAKNQEVFFGDDSSDITCLMPSTISINVTNEKAVINDICATSGQAGSLITGRSNLISFTAILPQDCVQNFARYRRGDTVRFLYNSGSKSDGTNWDAGKCCSIYVPAATISSLEVVDEDGIARMQAEIIPFINSGLGEIYASFV